MTTNRMLNQVEALTLWKGTASGSAAFLELAGVKNVVSKMLGSHNKINNVHAS